MTIHSFCFGPFSENTYVVYDESRECLIIDPGCSRPDEEKELQDFIESNFLKPVRLIQTHAHIDHILGNLFVYKTYHLLPEMHPFELDNFNMGEMVSKMYGIPYTAGPGPKNFLRESGELSFGHSKLEILFTPGHSAGSLSFYSKDDHAILSGDVLFQGSIGRTDLPGGNFETLASSIKTRLYTLPENTIVYSGHGEPTTIGEEKYTNPFVRE
jgi:hydroxyacylglutathione hydrolase